MDFENRIYFSTSFTSGMIWTWDLIQERAEWFRADNGQSLGGSTYTIINPPPAYHKMPRTPNWAVDPALRVGEGL